MDNQFLKDIIDKIESSTLNVGKKNVALALKYLKYCEDYASFNANNRREMKAIIGFDKADKPKLWDLTKGNLFFSGCSGEDVESFGATAIVTSLISLFKEEEFCYWFIAYSSDNIFEEQDSYCKEYVRYTFNDKKEYENSFFRLRAELKRREALSVADLKKEPFLLVILETPCLACGQESEVAFAIKDLFEKGRSLNVAVLLISNRSAIEWVYAEYKETFCCRMISIGEFLRRTDNEYVNKKIENLVENKKLTNVLISDNEKELVFNYSYSLGLVLREYLKAKKDMSKLLDLLKSHFVEKPIHGAMYVLSDGSILDCSFQDATYSGFHRYVIKVLRGESKEINEAKGMSRLCCLVENGLRKKGWIMIDTKQGFVESFKSATPVQEKKLKEIIEIFSQKFN